ncbi:MAG: T9SS type A sorting domain-containing protein [Flavobacterium sp.]|nr:T9SS type A sorting domain-containing protein [Flavobacterium sp.]
MNISLRQIIQITESSAYYGSRREICQIENGIISISNITTGIYLLEISTNGKPIIKRFIKQ